MSFDLWNYKGSEKALDNKKYLLSDLDEDDLDMFSGDDSFEDYGFEENWN